MIRYDYKLQAEYGLGEAHQDFEILPLIMNDVLILDYANELQHQERYYNAGALNDQNGAS